GEETSLVHEMRQIWGDTASFNKAPYIAHVTLDDRYAYDHIYLLPGKQYESTVFTFDPENDSLQIQWEVLPEAVEQDGNVGNQEKPAPVKGVIAKQDKKNVTLLTPKKEGAYRLFVYVYDGKNNYATANIPFYVTENPLH